MHKIKFLRVVACGATYETNISYLHTILKDFIKFQMAGSWPVGYLQSVEELNSDNYGQIWETDLNLETLGLDSRSAPKLRCILSVVF